MKFCRKLQLNMNPQFRSIDVYLYEEQGNEIWIAEPFEIVFRKIEEDENPPVSFRISQKEGYEFMKQFVQAMEDQGIKTDNQSKVEGKLEVTEKWLEDMRKFAMRDLP